MPAFCKAIATCSLTVFTPSKLGSNNPLLDGVLTITPYSYTSRSFIVHDSGSNNTSTDISSSPNSSFLTFENLGSSVAALIAFLIISVAIFCVTGPIVPIHPLSYPSFFKETKIPLLSFSISSSKPLKSFKDFPVS